MMANEKEAAARLRPTIGPEKPTVLGAFWAPEGTVRAALALGLVASYVVLTGLGAEADNIGTLAGVAVTFYFTARNGKSTGG